MPGTNKTQRDRPMTWTEAAAIPAAVIQRPSCRPLGESSEGDAGRCREGGAQRQRQEPAAHGRGVRPDSTIWLMAPIAKSVAANIAEA